MMAFSGPRNPHPLERFRVPEGGSSPRDIARIPMQELRLAILHVAESQFALPREALVRITAQILGYGRTSQDIGERFGEVIDDLIDGGDLRRNGPDQISPP